jgi:hypothetical protein
MGHTRSHEQRTWASVAFWNASNIFFSATVSLVFLSIALHTIPYAFSNEPGAAARSQGAP